MRNRRNYYRTLHVQRDAPAAVIKSCYRALMHTLKMHPDRGGDHWNAAMLNEAYAVLSCSKQRAAYDKTLSRPARSAEPGPSSAVQAVTTVADDDFCAFCGRSHLPDARNCASCKSPLSMGSEWSSSSSGRRGGNRIALDQEVRLFTDWPSTAALTARIRDVSPGGLSLSTQAPLDRHDIVKIESEALHAVARVAHCRAGTAGVEFFTLRLPRTAGVFLSVSG